MNIKKMGVSSITNTIFYGSVNEEKHMWVGEKKDVTDTAIGAVFEWFMGNMKDKQEFEIRYPSVNGLVLKMVREDNLEVDNKKDV